MIKKISLFFIALITLFLPQTALADGGVFPPPDKYVTETDQKAIIAFENNLETLILSVNFKGDPEDFGWVIPIPSKPEITKSQDNLFQALSDLTQPITTQTPTMSNGFNLLDKATTAETHVSIVETQEIENYDITTITANDSKALAKWLADNKYQVPETASGIFEDYVQKSWYFICIKLDLSKTTAAAKDQLKSGHATPLKIQFESKQIIFPLKLTSILSEYEELSPDAKNEVKGLTRLPQISIMLYVLADGKKTAPGFTTQFAKWLRRNEIQDLSQDTEGSSWYQPKAPKLYLTKLYRSMSTAQMTDDLVISSVSNNETVGTSANNLWLDIITAVVVFALSLVIIILSPLGLLYFIFALVQFFSKSKTAHIVAWIFQSLLILLTLLVGLVVSLVVSDNFKNNVAIDSIGYNYRFDWSGVGVLTAIVMVIACQTVVLFYQRRHHQTLIQTKNDNPENKADEMFEGEKQEK